MVSTDSALPGGDVVIQYVENETDGDEAPSSSYDKINSGLLDGDIDGDESGDCDVDEHGSSSNDDLSPEQKRSPRKNQERKQPTNPVLKNQQMTMGHQTYLPEVLEDNAE